MEIHIYSGLIACPKARQLLGDIGKTSEWALRKAGLLPEPVPVTGRRVAYPGRELKAIIDARSAGMSEAQIRALVERLHAARNEL